MTIKKILTLMAFFSLLTPHFAAALSDSYTFSLPLPHKRLDARNFLSGPEHWVGTIAPVKAFLPGTKPVTEIHKRKITSDGKVEEHWESCNDSCGPGCGKKDDLMGGCKVKNGPMDPISYSWKKADGGTVTCEYEAWECKSHSRCRSHDRCLIDCKTKKNISKTLCKSLCHAKATGICASVGGWIWGDPIPGCWSSKILYTRVIQGSCRG